jgi:soluble lytic murein transglycosylase-like protein
MRRALATLVALGLLATACTTAGGEVRSSGPTATAPTGTPGPTGVEPATGATGTNAGDPELPDPDQRIPRDPRRLADALAATWTARRTAVDAWVASGGSSAWPPPEELELLVLFEQRIYRELAGDARLARRVLDRLPRGLAAEARANVGAGSALVRHFVPPKVAPELRVRAPEPAEALRRYFEAAQERFGVPWELLAAVMLIETRMGRVVSHSSAGAQGPMQFLPSTWEAYGLGGDVRDPRDAIMGAANYLASSGSPDDDRQALYRYNPVRAYVTAVSSYARAIERDPDAFYAYYHWQVFVRSTRGDTRLTGPGLD